MTLDEIMMLRAQEIAVMGQGSVSPNPMVGCVITRNGQIIGEGWHKKFGEAHAEVNAVASVKEKDVLKEATLYVNLEPCTHFGKTPPCTDLLIRHQFKRIVISNVDPNPVSGGGIKKLRGAGIAVISGVKEKQGHELNKRFFTYLTKKRPFIILKFAQTSDGYLAARSSESKWISNNISRQLVHRWRSEEDAILVGNRTAANDNPQLNVREWSGRNPVRVVIDRFLRLNHTLHLFDRSQPTLCYNLMKHEERPNLILVRLNEEDFIGQLVHDLYLRNLQSVMVEGGVQVLNLFIKSSLWDEARVFTSIRTFGSGMEAPRVPGKLSGSFRIGSDSLKIFRNEQN